MAEKITSELFNHLVELAALELESGEAEYLRRELNNQLKAIDELAAIPIPDDTPIASHGVPYPADVRPELRKDVAVLAPESAAILEHAPQVDDRYFVVPEIPHEDLE
jgi:aspartyl-tRNA(Asn)/glutamyl-tRNA(Gln) amidotransferase subunit C